MTTHAAAASAHAAARDEGMSRGMAGMVLFIASEVMLFGGLFAGYFFVRVQADVWPPGTVDHRLDAAIGGILTAVLISSSVAAHWGIVGIKRGNRQQLKLGIALAVVLGTIFIGGQIYEWLSLMDEGFNAGSTVYGSSFFIITGFHGAHVIGGLCLLWVVLVRAYWHDFTPSRHLIADASVLYWHFVDVIWVFVYSTLYLSY